MRRATLIVAAVAILLAGSGATWAGDLEPPGPPAPTMKSLDEIPPAWSQILDSTDGDVDGCNSSRFKCVMNNEAVLDLETGLVWERAGSAVTSWTSAQTSCPNHTTGGRRGWHLPWLEEMQSLFDPGQSNPALPPENPFTGLTASGYWTSTTKVNDSTTAITVSLATGSGGGTPKSMTTAGFLCVRGGTPSIVNFNN